MTEGFLVGEVRLVGGISVCFWGSFLGSELVVGRRSLGVFLFRVLFAVGVVFYRVVFCVDFRIGGG